MKSAAPPRRRSVLFLLAMLGCRGTLSPLSNRIDIGQESYFVFVADGEDGLGDLFAAAPVGGQAYQITYTRLDEQQPRLSPDGVVLAFLRRSHGDSARLEPVFMNLVNGAERTIADAGDVTALAWSADGTQLYLRGASGIKVVDAPPARSVVRTVDGAMLATADSAFKVLLGEPPVGEAISCEQGGVCASVASGVTLLAAEGKFPANWGKDSLVYSVGNDLIVRPLGGGATRTVRFTGALKSPRQVSLFLSQR
ncbi:MAG TPA: hypothetical protein VG817_12210 [Gemmatimonadales bacterium]|nr:hypothetical protein [Gemmatimonadales bacterium]